MEPLNATVGAQGRLDAGGDLVRLAVPDDRPRCWPRRPRIKPEAVDLITTFAGGGIRRRRQPSADYVVEAVQVAKAMKQAGIDAPGQGHSGHARDDMRGGYYRPVHVHRVAIGVAFESMPATWQHTIVAQSILRALHCERVMVKNGITRRRSKALPDTPYNLGRCRSTSTTRKSTFPCCVGAPGREHNPTPRS